MSRHVLKKPSPVPPAEVLRYKIRTERRGHVRPLAQASAALSALGRNHCCGFKSWCQEHSRGSLHPAAHRSSTWPSKHEFSLFSPHFFAASRWRNCPRLIASKTSFYQNNYIKLIQLLPGSTLSPLAFTGSWGEDLGRQQQLRGGKREEGTEIWAAQATGVTK